MILGFLSMEYWTCYKRISSVVETGSLCGGVMQRIKDDSINFTFLWILKESLAIFLSMWI
jgi:hypothetical protein